MRRTRMAGSHKYAMGCSYSFWRPHTHARTHTHTHTLELMIHTVDISTKMSTHKIFRMNLHKFKLKYVIVMLARCKPFILEVCLEKWCWIIAAKCLFIWWTVVKNLYSIIIPNSLLFRRYLLWIEARNRLFDCNYVCPIANCVQTRLPYS